jgi:hypothetical protein
LDKFNGWPALSGSHNSDPFAARPNHKNKLIKHNKIKQERTGEE